MVSTSKIDNNTTKDNSSICGNAEAEFRVAFSTRILLNITQYRLNLQVSFHKFVLDPAKQKINPTLNNQRGFSRVEQFNLRHIPILAL